MAAKAVAVYMNVLPPTQSLSLLSFGWVGITDDIFSESIGSLTVGSCTVQVLQNRSTLFGVRQVMVRNEWYESFRRNLGNQVFAKRSGDVECQYA